MQKKIYSQVVSLIGLESGKPLELPEDFRGKGGTGLC